MSLFSLSLRWSHQAYANLKSKRLCNEGSGRHGSDVLGTRGCRTTMIPSLNRNAAEVQRIVAPAWQGLSAMPDSAYSPLPPLVPDKAGGRRSNIIVDFIWGGACVTFVPTCVTGTSWCVYVSKYFSKRGEKRTVRLHIMFGGRCISWVSAASVSILDQYGPIMTAARLCTRGC